VNRSGIVLLVEDNEDDITLAKRAFQSNRLVRDLVVARDGHQALEYLFATGAHADRTLPDVVLLDLKLPLIDGHEVLRRIRANDETRRLPVVVLTSSSESDDIAMSYDLGANSFIRKPIDFTAFVESARQIGLYWLSMNEPPRD
jgi:two-component system, response regulator